MAEKATGAAKKKKAVKAPRKEVREKPGKGHNLEALREEGEGIVAEYLELAKSMDSDMAGYRSDFNDLYDKASDKLGIKKSVLSRELKRIRAAKKAEEKEQEMAPDEREQTELFREAMEGTPFGDYAAGELAKPKVKDE